MSDDRCSIVSVSHGVADSGKSFRGTIKMVDRSYHWDVDVKLYRNDNDTVKGRFKMDVHMKHADQKDAGAKYIYYVYDDLDHSRGDALYADMMGEQLKANWLAIVESYVGHAIACGL